MRAGRASAAAAAPREAPAGRQPRVLVAEDYAPNQAVLRLRLTSDKPFALIAARLGAHVYDPEPAIAALGHETDIFYDYAHLTVAGNHLVATGLSSLLIEKELLPSAGSVATSGQTSPSALGFC